jgi:hypothetical protein
MSHTQLYEVHVKYVEHQCVSSLIVSRSQVAFGLGSPEYPSKLLLFNLTP